MFNVGDLVYLKSGGPCMTVSTTYPGSTDVECQWFSDDHKLRAGDFMAEVLELFVEPVK